jgi:ech hydrogenase subunit D
MYEAQKIEEIAKKDLIDKVQSLCTGGYRLVQISGRQEAEALCVDYTFDKNYAFYNLRLKLPLTDLHLPSISKVCFPAFLYENEIHDLFGVKIDNIVVDYAGKFYRIEKNAPFMLELEN